MRPKERRDSGQTDMFRARLDQNIGRWHGHARFAGRRPPPPEPPSPKIRPLWSSKIQPVLANPVKANIINVDPRK